MPAVAIASVSSVALHEQGEEVGRGRRRQEAGEEVRHHLQVAAVEELPGLELGEHEQRPEDDDGDEQRRQPARAPPGRAAARRRHGRCVAGERRSLAARPLERDDVAGASVVERLDALRRAARGLRWRRARAASRVVTAAVGRSKTTSPALHADRCAGTTSAPGRPRAATRPASRRVASLCVDERADAWSASVGIERRHRLVGEDAAPGRW